MNCENWELVVFWIAFSTYAVIEVTAVCLNSEYRKAYRRWFSFQDILGIERLGFWFPWAGFFAAVAVVFLGTEFLQVWQDCQPKTPLANN